MGLYAFECWSKSREAKANLTRTEEEEEPTLLLLAIMETQKVAFVNEIQNEPQLQAKGKDRLTSTLGTLTTLQVIICPGSESTSMIWMSQSRDM